MHYVDIALRLTDSEIYYKAMIVNSETSLICCRYEFRLRVTLGPGGDLMLTSRIRNMNTDGKSFSFTFAYHTYFAVTDIRSVYPFDCHHFGHFCFTEKFREAGF